MRWPRSSISVAISDRFQRFLERERGGGEREERRERKERNQRGFVITRLGPKGFERAQERAGFSQGEEDARK